MIRYVTGRFSSGEIDYMVYVGDQALFSLSLYRVSLLADEVYIKLCPYRGLRAASIGVLRKLRTDFNEKLDEKSVGFDIKLICQIKRGNTAGVRFAEFFGFKLAGMAVGRLHYVRTK